ncbi:MAG: alpha-amylase family glycosyl hydrolase [Solirubrobacteraceae bacterium]|nr:alpha-amylase family glycosyl hydrolase [Solirubrobacteraceae bacterium]
MSDRADSGGPWWRDAVVYQVYPRSFQDSDGDGEGDLRGIAARLEHVRQLGADAIWLSPVYPSPMADGGYDVADYEQVDPRFGTLADADALIAAAHERGLRLLMDVVPCHTSIEHPWFAEHPERYVWSPRDDGPPNNWIASFGGPAWSRDPRTGRWYLHSFYPEQPDLDWRRQDVRDAVAGALRFWLARGVDGFRLDAVDHLLKDSQLRDDPPASAPPVLPEHADAERLEQIHSRNAPDIGGALAALREAAGDTLLAGEVYLPWRQLAPYLAHVDCAFAFELLHAPWEAAAIRAAIAAALQDDSSGEQVAWVLSNHDFPRLPDRVGARNARAAAMLSLTLPGAVFVYQGDELGMADGPGGDPPHDRAGRDRHRHPMRWDDDLPHGDFTVSEAQPWLPAIAVAGGGVAQQRTDPDSILHLYRDLIALRRTLGAGLTFLGEDEGVADGVLAYRRGDEHLVALNLGDEPRPAPSAGRVLRRTHAARTPAGLAAPVQLLPGEGFLAMI